MAVIGRQLLHHALFAQQLISVSAPAVFNMANSRASSTRVSRSPSAITRNVLLNIGTGLAVKKLAMASCSVLRPVPASPSRFTSSYSFA
jgi:hypothetical protein